MQSPASILSGALQVHTCCVSKLEPNWSFHFGKRLIIVVSVPWRIVTADGISYGDEDDGQRFGLAEPVNGEAESNRLLRGQKVIGVELETKTADLRVVFDGGARLDIFNNSSGFEGWQASLPAGGHELTIIAHGSGGLTAL